MDLGVLRRGSTGGQPSSRMGTCTSAFLPSWSSSVRLPVALIQGSVALPRGFPTGLSQVPPWCESILGVQVDAVHGNQVPLEWTTTTGGLLNAGTTPGVRLDFPVESASSRDSTGMQGILSRRSRERTLTSSYKSETGLLLMMPGPSVFPRVETGMSGNFLSCRKDVKDLLEVQEGRCDFPRDASAEKGLISLRGKLPGQTRVVVCPSRVATGTSGTRSFGLRQGKSPCELLRASRDSSAVGALA